MAGQEFKARGRLVKKMTRKGLTEENLKEGTVKDISSRDPDPGRDGAYGNPPEEKTSSPAAAGSPGARDRKYRKAREKKLKNTRTGRGPSEREVPFSFERQETGNGGEGRKKAPGRKPGQPELSPEASENGYSAKLRDQEGMADLDLLEQREAIKKKQKRRQLYPTGEKRGRRPFSGSMKGLSGTGTKPGRKAGSPEHMADRLWGNAGDKEDENSGVEALRAGTDLAEEASHRLREAQNRSNRTSGRLMRRGFWETDSSGGMRLRFTEAENAIKTETIAQAGNRAEAEAKRVRTASRFWQKKRYKDAYKAARKGRQAAGGGTIGPGGAVMESLTEKGKRAVREILVKNRAVFLTLGVTALIFIIISVSLFSCSASIQGAGSLIRITTYQSTDQDIYAAENAYRALERGLDTQINDMERRHPGHEDYRYQIDEIGHNPYHLISYLTAKYGVWTFRDVRNELRPLFEQQYTLETEHEPVGSTRTVMVRVGESLGDVVTSGYCNCAQCCGQWAGGATASGVMPTANHTIAVDSSNPTVPMGTKVVMNGVEYTVEDTGNFDQYGVDFDVYYDEHADAQAHGHQTWEAFIADDNGDREVEVRVTTRRDTFSVTLTNSGFDAVARANLSEEELKIYEALNITLGNRDYLFDLSNEYAGGGGQEYQIPPSALSDERAARMIRKAVRYLGTPYQWGGSSPSGFDCSGFVSYVINHCGNGWNVGRCSAEGLREKCAYVSPAQARPGDLIFFKGTYNTSGASHVGIYLGNGMMIHCGRPVQYASINRDYWKRHFLSFGRIR